MGQYTAEKEIKVYDNTDGSYIHIKEDPDGLNLVWVSNIDSEGGRDGDLGMFPIEQMRKVAKGILELCDHIESKENAERT